MTVTQYDTCPPTHLTFVDVLSRRTAYGLIWIGKLQHQICVVKMIMLTTGYHYDKNIRGYLTPNKKILSESEATQYFGHNEAKPFYHFDFRHRRSMTPEAFFTEVEELMNLGELGIAPKIYGCGVNESHDIHYGFIVMEKADCSLKDIYLHRDLHHDEHKVVKSLINCLHDEHGIIHGDLKPSNIGVYLTPEKTVARACFFDCQKIKHREDLTDEQFIKLAAREGDNYKKHIIKNMFDDPKTGLLN